MANESRQILVENIKNIRLQQGEKANKNMLKPKQVNWLYPFAMEKKYLRYQMSDLIRPQQKIVNTNIKAHYSRWVKEASIFDSGVKCKPPLIIGDDDNELRNREWRKVKPQKGLLTRNFDSVTITFTHDNIVTDQYVDEIQAMIQEMNEQMISEFGTELQADETSNVYQQLLLISTGVFVFNKRQWNKTTRSILGYPFQTQERWWDEVQELWAEENYNLLRRYETDYISNVNEIVSRGVRTGIPEDEITKELNKALNTRINKAKLLSADQIGKLNGLITQRRQVESGISYYTWRTRKDEKVRGNPAGNSPNAIPNHWIMEGLLCRWDDNSLYADPIADVERDENNLVTRINWRSRTADMPFAIPGEEIRCRCSGNAWLDEIISEAENQLQEAA